MQVNKTNIIGTSSNGAWEGDNPLDYAFPLLILQTTLIIVVSRFFAFLLKPLRQPKVVAEMLAGIVLGPSAFGRNQYYMHRIFPRWSTPILESVASIGLLFFLFLVGLELDLSSMRRSGRKAFAVAAAGISFPFILGIGIAFVFRKAIDGLDKVGFLQFLVFMGVALSITAFPVLARILAELKLLTTRIGETAMAAAAFNDVAAWILLALAIAIAGNGPEGTQKSPLVSIWVLLSGIGFVVFMMIVIKPAMNWVAKRCSPQCDTVDEVYVCLTLVGVMLAGFATDLIGIHAIFGGFVFGLTIPKEGEFAETLIERIEDFVSGLLLPLYFASSGLKTDAAKICGVEDWGLLALVITTACVGKIIGTFIVAVLCKMPAREAITLGFLMNTKGLVELIVLNIGKEKGVLNDEVFAILVLMAIFTTFITTPTVMAIHKPARGKFMTAPSSHGKLHFNSDGVKDELRILACVHGPGNIPSLIDLIESTRSTNNKSKLKLYIMHLVVLTERSSSIMLFQRFRKNGFGLRRGGGELHDRVVVAIQAYNQVGRVRVRSATAVSALSTMHEDICDMAEKKGVKMIILPFHKQWRIMKKDDDDGDYEEMETNVGHGWRGVNQRVLNDAPCSVAVLVDRGLITSASSSGCQQRAANRVCIIFIGGADDRKALELGGRMVEHPAVKLTVIRFLQKQVMEANGLHKLSTAATKLQTEKDLDEATMIGFRRRWDGVVEYTEKEIAGNVVEAVLTIGRSGDYELIVVGKGRCPLAMAAELAAGRQAEHAELGPIGDVLASSGQGIVSSILVVQQHDIIAHADEVPLSKMYDDGAVTPLETSSLGV